jgi:hypothetical protein
MNSDQAYQQEQLNEEHELNQSTEVAPMSEPLYPNVLICGGSGTGKSTSLRNLNKETTAIINTERKVLPFRDARKFTKHRNVSSLAEFNSKLHHALKDDEINTVVIDSLTSLIEMVYEEMIMKVDKVGDNVMAGWANYRDTLHGILLRAKAANKFVVFIAIEDSIQDELMRITKTVAVQGSLKGKICKEFEIALWTKVIDAENPSDQYKFVTNGDPANESKSPMDMFQDKLIPNDLNQVLNTAYDYFNN